VDETESQPNSSNLEALEALQADTPELERLEGLLHRFNFFETIGFVGQELMHSRFLAFLLDPNQSHGLGVLFLKRFLEAEIQRTAMDSQGVYCLLTMNPEAIHNRLRLRMEHHYRKLKFRHDGREYGGPGKGQDVA
jgi:hypothetical protein